MKKMAISFLHVRDEQSREHSKGPGMKSPKYEDKTDDAEEKAVNTLKRTIAEHCLAGEKYEATLHLRSALTGDPLAVDVDEILDTDGNLTFIIYNAEGKPYKLMLTFSSELDRNARPPVTKVDNKTVTDAKEVSWHLTNMGTSYDNTIIDNQ